MSQAKLTSFFGEKGTKRSRVDEPSHGAAADTDSQSITRAESGDSGVATKKGCTEHWSASHLPQGRVPSPSQEELNRMSTAFQRVSTLKEFSEALSAIQPDFSGRISGLSRALEWDSAPCSEQVFIAE